MNEIQLAEARATSGIQITIENIHEHRGFRLEFVGVGGGDRNRFQEGRSVFLAFAIFCIFAGEYVGNLNIFSTRRRMV